MRLLPQYLAGMALLLAMMAFLYQHGGTEAAPMRVELKEFPVEIGGRWRGYDEAIPSDVLDVLKADDVLMRRYQDDRTGLLWLFVGYYRSQRTGATYHSPLNCLPGGGWAILSREEVPVSVGGQVFSMNRVMVGKGLDKQLILYWYQDRGRIITSEYVAKGYLVWDAMTRNRTDGALVRVSVPVTGSSEEAFSLGKQFVQDVFPLLSRHLPG